MATTTKYPERWHQFFDGRYTPDGDCLIWNNKPTAKGYGAVYDGGKTRLAHRKSWELFSGPIPDGRQIDHFICFRRNCIKPEHLRVATHAKNQQNRKSSNANNKTSGFRNVYPESGSATWFVQLISDGVQHRRSGFKTPEAANRAAIALRAEVNR